MEGSEAAPQRFVGVKSVPETVRLRRDANEIWSMTDATPRWSSVMSMSCLVGKWTEGARRALARRGPQCIQAHSAFASARDGARSPFDDGMEPALLGNTSVDYEQA